MNRFFTYPLIVFLLLLPVAGFAQFLSIEIEVEPETDARVEQSLDFGQIISNSGLVQINPGDPNMGVFSINAVRWQRILLSMQTPDFLEHPNLDSRVPLDLQLAYVDFGVNDYRLARQLTSPQEELVIYPPPISRRVNGQPPIYTCTERLMWETCRPAPM
ncbi:MAG: hypothetical protein WD035_01685 [Balneolaceae bacterium]